ncbi:hypothetical protein M1563_05080 [Patescibacteria group bacterium]|nr:hypothetical protein [Patescibacteria group bacterium]MCL5409425.1 hypothetical protein [Patescibacteria group bacterium]
MINKFKYIFLLLVCCGFFLPSGVHAQQTNLGMAISPPTFEISANPGDTLQNTIKLTNLTNDPLNVSVDRRNFTAIGEEGAVGLTNEETTFSLASWITVDPEQVTVPAKQSYIFSFKINVPLNAEPGGHFGSIVFRTGGVKQNQAGAAVTQELGSLILLKVAGDTTTKASVASFNSAQNLWEYGPVVFDTRVTNEGNVHVKPTGTITITDVLGQKVATIQLDQRNVLPGATRKVDSAWNQHLLFGKYTATLSLVYGNGQLLTATTTFIGFPYKIAAVVLVVLIIITFFLYRMRRRLKLAMGVLSGKYKV